MKKYMFLMLSAAFLLTVSSAFAQKFTLSSAGLTKDFALPFYSKDCGGDNLSPQLSWENAPKGTAAFAVTMKDYTAKAGIGHWHWLVYNIPVKTTALVEGAGNPAAGLLPKGAKTLLNDDGIYGYKGPCPPGGSRHLNRFTVYALRNNITVPKKATPAEAAIIFEENSIARATLTSYSRNCVK